MVAVNIGDLLQEEDEQERPPLIEPGWYDCTIIDSFEFTTDKGDQSVKVILQTDSGRTIHDVFNLYHPKESVAELSNKQLRALARAAKLGELGDTQQLHDKRVQADIFINGTFNNVKQYRTANGAAPPPTPPKPNASTEDWGLN